MRLRHTGIVLLLLVAAWVQPSQGQHPSGAAAPRKDSKPVTAEDLRVLREAMAAQQEQIAAQNREIQRLRNELQATQQKIEQKIADTQAANEQSHNRLAVAEELDKTRRELATKIENDVSDVRTVLSETVSTAERADKTSLAGVESGFGHIRFSGLLQVWGIAGDAGYRDTFRIRRAELKVGGQITDKARWTVMIDPSKSLSLNTSYLPTGGNAVLTNVAVNQSSRILQDAFISTDYIPHVRVDVGQFKIPLSLEGAESSASLATAERALFMSDRVRGGAYGDIRDIGVMVSGSIKKRVDFYLGEFNSVGDRQNDVAVNDQKATVGRLVFRLTPWLQVGGSGAYSNGGSRPDRLRRDRIGAELLARYRSFTFQAEWMQGKEGDVLRQGYYALAKYRRGKLEPVIRFDLFDPDVRHQNLSALTAPERDFVAGVNWYLTETHFKLQSNYVRKVFAKEIVPSRNLVFLNFQTSW